MSFWDKAYENALKRDLIKMYDDFASDSISVNGVKIFFRIKGNGPPVMLIHGFPQTHVCWHLIAPELTKMFTVICPDLRGYGASSKPESDKKHNSYSKRAMGSDL